MDNEQYMRYVNSGTVHILSVSGIHTGMLYVSLGYILQIFTKASRRRRAMLTLFGVVLFTLMTGVRLSSLRSAVVAGMYGLAEISDREPDAPTALSLSALLLLALEPNAMFDAGFLLSFLSVASIILFYETFEEQLSLIRPSLSNARRKIYSVILKSGNKYAGDSQAVPDDAPNKFWIQTRAAASVSLGAQILPTPFAIRVFHVFPLFGVLANLIIVPLTTIALWLCMGASLIAMFSTRAGVIFGYSLLPVTSLIDEVARVTASFRIGHFNVTTPTVSGMFFYYLAVGLAFMATQPTFHKKRLFALTVGAAMLCVVFWSPLRQEPMISFLDVGHGDSIFVRSSKGGTMLVDAGDAQGKMDMGERVVAPFLWSNHARRIDFLVASHGDSDHIGGMQYILKSFDVGTMCVASAGWNRPHEKALLALCADLGVPVRTLSAGESFKLDDFATVEVLSPPADLPESRSRSESAENVNNNSLVLRLRQDGVPILLPGDIQKETENRLASADCGASVLKVPHHGSKTSSSPEFIDAVAPSDCVISVGDRRGGTSLNEDVLDRYQERGIRIWRTDLLGGIRLRFHDGSATIDAARPDRGYPYCANAAGEKLSFP
jgi:competence protein ComEC